jgi:uncharacterized membrane protein
MMNTTSVRYPIDLMLCLLLSVILVPTQLWAIPGPQRMLLGIPFLIFVPGYIMIFALFPMRKKKRTIDGVERIALSFAASIALVPLIAFALNFSPWGIRLEPLTLALAILAIITALIGLTRWYRLPPEERFAPTRKTPNTDTTRHGTKLTALMIVFIVILLAVFLYTATHPRPGEAYTAFYLTGPDGKIADYPLNVQANTTTTLNLTILNHEQRPMNYTVTAWLSDEGTVQNQTHQNMTIYYHFWYLGTITNQSHIGPIPPDTPWSTNYNFSFNKSGTFHIHFLLSTTTPQPHELWRDYAGIAGQILTQAYERLSLAISVH